MRAPLPPGESCADEQRHGHGTEGEHDHRPRLAVLVVEAARRRVARRRVPSFPPAPPQDLPLGGELEHLRESHALWLGLGREGGEDEAARRGVNYRA